MDICKHDQFCGGCVYQGMPYNEQLALKEKEVIKLMEDKDVHSEKIEPIEGSPIQYRYRNKMEYTFGDLVKDGPMTLGMHKKGNFMSVVTVDDCQLVHEDFNIILDCTINFCKEYTKYHKRAHKGMMRNLIVRAGIHTKEILVNVVTTSELGFDEEKFVDIISSLKLENEVVGILRTINDNVADAVKCEKLKILKGRDYYMEEIMGLDFKVSAFSFFQTNVIAVEKLYSEALELIDDYRDKNVFDLFCGTGTITQTLALKAAQVTGIEIIPEAVEAAKENAKLNNLENCQFICGDVFKVLRELNKKPDIIVVDPPRMGIGEKALDLIIKYDVKQLIYISCNPKTLFDNLYYLSYHNYKLKYLKPFDNFPNTKHTECIALLEK